MLLGFSSFSQWRLDNLGKLEQVHCNLWWRNSNTLSLMHQPTHGPWRETLCGSEGNDSGLQQRRALSRYNLAKKTANYFLNMTRPSSFRLLHMATTDSCNKTLTYLASPWRPPPSQGKDPGNEVDLTCYCSFSLSFSTDCLRSQSNLFCLLFFLYIYFFTRVQLHR